MDSPSLQITPSARGDWLRGVAQAAPIALGYVPIGFAYGVLAQKAGLSPLNTLLMSVLVYAGSSQLIAVGLFAAGAPALSIVFATLVVNLRHLLLSASLSPYLQRWRPVELAAFAYQLTDETFAVHAARFASGIVHKAEVYATNATAQVAWVGGTWLGIVAGQLIADVRPLALDYVLPALFVALLVFQTQDRIQVGVAVVAGLLAVALSLVGVGPWNVIAATLVAATLGVIVEQLLDGRWTKQSSP